ncbi:MAG: GGDEF domain-containing protein [Fibrobacteraceae bacterium]|nr:GGDEF domain-containing protein [Fibrobacteraceae bacterium]
MNWTLYILWLISFLGGVAFVYLIPSASLALGFRFALIALWGAVLGGILNVLASKGNKKATSEFSFDAAIAKKTKSETELIPIINGMQSRETKEIPPVKETIIKPPEFPNAKWQEFSHGLLRNRPFPEVIGNFSKLLPEIFKGASGILYMYSENQSELHQIFAFGPNTIGDPVIAPAECASFDSGEIVIANYSLPNFIGGCTHLHHRPKGYSFCAPVEGLEEHFGILTIQVDALPKGETAESWKTKISIAATTFGLFVANQNLQFRFQTQSLRDTLTGLVNKRYMEEALTRAVSEAKRHNTPIGMIMFHPDMLESLKDARGPHVAEQMLWELAQRLPRYIRSEDIPCRYTNEVLCVLLPGADRSITEQRAEQIRHEIENLQVAYGNSILETTLSLGVATFPDNAQNVKDLIACAEQSMYQAEALGRNQVCVSQVKSAT